MTTVTISLREIPKNFIIWKFLECKCREKQKFLKLNNSDNNKKVTPLLDDFPLQEPLLGHLALRKCRSHREMVIYIQFYLDINNRKILKLLGD